MAQPDHSSAGCETPATHPVHIAGASAQAEESPWDKAFRRLSADDQKRLNHMKGDKLNVLEDVRVTVKEKKKLCLEKRWAIKKLNGERIILRDVCEKVIVWVDKFKQVGDAAVQYDPGHAALPWAGVRFILQVRCALKQQRSVAEHLRLWSTTRTRFTP